MSVWFAIQYSPRHTCYAIASPLYHLLVRALVSHTNQPIRDLPVSQSVSHQSPNPSVTSHPDPIRQSLGRHYTTAPCSNPQRQCLFCECAREACTTPAAACGRGVTSSSERTPPGQLTCDHPPVTPLPSPPPLPPPPTRSRSDLLRRTRRALRHDRRLFTQTRRVRHSRAT